MQQTKSEMLAQVDSFSEEIHQALRTANQIVAPPDSFMEEIYQELRTANQIVAAPCHQLQKIVACLLVAVMLIVVMTMFTHLSSPRFGVSRCAKSGKNRLIGSFAYV